MCKSMNLNFREHIDHILDFGSSHSKVLAPLRYAFHAQYANGIYVDKSVIQQNECVCEGLKKLKDDHCDLTICDKTLSALDDG